MVNNIVATLLFASIIVTAWLLVSTVIKCRSEKKNIFIFCLLGTLLYVSGNFFEVTSFDLGGALTAVKVMYVGGCFMSPLFLMFVLDYCEIAVRLWQRIILIIVPFVNMALVWTTDMTGLIYKDFRYTGGESTIHGLQILEQGPLYYMVYAVSIICIIISFIVIVRRHFIWGNRYRKSLFLLFLISAGPMIANLMYIIGTYILKSDLHGINFTPYVLVVTSTMFYLSVLRYDLFDFSTRATSVTVDIVHDAVIFVDMNDNFSSANAVAKELLPPLVSFPKGQPVTEAEGWPKELKDLKDFDVAKEISLTLEKCGETRYYKVRVKPIEANERKIGMVLLIRDATDVERLMRQLENAAYTDALTGIYNRLHFMEVATILLERARRAGTPCSMLMFDLDKFKDINDTYGHIAGDEVLRAVSATVRDAIRSYDVLGRYGGEEFVVLMDSANIDAAAGRAEYIRKIVESTTIHYENIDIHITCSIGVAETPDSSEDILSLIGRADAALYCAKHDGRNLVRKSGHPN